MHQSYTPNRFTTTVQFYHQNTTNHIYVKHHFLSNSHTNENYLPYLTKWLNRPNSFKNTKTHLAPHDALSIPRNNARTIMTCRYDH